MDDLRRLAWRGRRFWKSRKGAAKPSWRKDTLCMGSGAFPRDTEPAMSDKNLTTLSEGFERFEREGAPIFDLLDPEVEILNFDSFPVTRPHLGHEER
jgi:hypothetical protein